MKKLLLVVISSLIFFSINAFAGCSSCSSSSSSSVGNCEGSGPGCTANTCQCTDPYCSNPGCMDTCACCKAFGNIGNSSINDTQEPDNYVIQGQQESEQTYAYTYK